MMNSTPTTGRTTKRALGLGMAVLSISLLSTVSRADNTTSATAKSLPINSGITDCVTAGQTKYYYADLFKGRSYAWEVYDVGFEKNAAVPIMFQHVVSTSSTMTPALTLVSSAVGLEGSMNVSLYTANRNVRFMPTASGVHYMSILEGNGNSGCYYVSIRETTLFSPWLSKAAGYEGFIELHNNTVAAINVTLNGYDSTGTLQGTGLTFSLPGNATVFQTGATIGVPAGVAAGVVLTHDGGFGAISGNITTLNGATGLSFDSPFTPRSDYVRLH